MKSIRLGLPFATDGDGESMRDENVKGSDALFTKYRAYRVILVNVEENELPVISCRYKAVEQMRAEKRIAL